MGESVLADLRGTLYRQAPVICAGLETPCRFAVAVVVFRDQARFDEANPKMRGYFAYSSTGKIEMVSPTQGRSRGLSYRDGLMIAAHEFTHLALNEVNPLLVDWFQEGAAVYFGPSEGTRVYDRACVGIRDRPLPKIQELTKHYHSVTAADLLAYSLVSSLAHSYGSDRVKALLRAPSDIPSALETTWSALETSWQQHVHQGCPDERPGRALDS